MYTKMAWNSAEVDYFTLIGNNNNCTLYPKCIDDQYSYYEETVNRKVNMKIL